jgi:hypothetical protein
MFLAFVGSTQTTTNSLYSKYGIGILRSESFLQNFSMGGIGLGLRSNRNINNTNPASYSALSISTFEFGFINTALWMDDGVESQYQNNPYISHIAFGIPIIKNKWGMGFGLLPYSNVGFEYSEVISDSIAGDVSYINKGDGGINKVYFTNSARFNIDTTSLFSLGVNGYFLFGSKNFDQKIIYGDLSNSVNIWDIEENSVADFGVDFGVQYQKTFIDTVKDEKYKLTVGATYGLATDLKAKHTQIVRSFTGSSDFGVVKDTITLIEDAADIVQLPSSYGVGFSLEKVNKWTFGVDYSASDWGKLESNSTIFSYNSNYSIAVGFEVIPKHDAFNHYFKRVAYRFGARYNTSYILIGNQELTEYGITFGVGLPFKRAETAIPRISFGFEYGSRGKAQDGLIRETFFNFNVGLTINDRWFIKRKYD